MGLLINIGRRGGVPRMQRLCARCDIHDIADERYLIFECAALQPVWDRTCLVKVLLP